MATFIKAGFWDKLCQPCKGYKGWLNLDELIQSFIPKLKYKVFTALLTQSGGDDLLFLSEGPLTIGVTYLIVDSGDIDFDFTNVGAPNNNPDTSFIATGTTPNLWINGTLAYNTGAPVVTVLENTIGNIWFTYSIVGSYYANSDNLFINNKSTIILGNPYWETGIGYIQSGFDGESFANIKTLDFSSIPIDGEILNNTPIEIRVYS